MTGGHPAVTDHCQRLHCVFRLYKWLQQQLLQLLLKQLHQMYSSFNLHLLQLTAQR